MGTNIEEIKRKVLPILQRHGIKKAGLFGSYVRGNHTADSDIDILVEIDKDISLLDFIGIKIDIEEALGRKIDLVEYGTVKPALMQTIFNEQVALL